VDELRHLGVSIVSLSRRRDTLEEAFLDIVSQGAIAPIVLGAQPVAVPVPPIQDKPPR
jgi:hypothetical protein